MYKELYLKYYMQLLLYVVLNKYNCKQNYISGSVFKNIVGNFVTKYNCALNNLTRFKIYVYTYMYIYVYVYACKDFFISIKYIYL